MMLGIGEKLQGVLFYVNISAYLLIVAVVAAFLIGMDFRYLSPLSFATLGYLGVMIENGLSLSDMIILSKSMDSTNS